MPVSVMRRAIDEIYSAGLITERLSIVWHAGEPTVLPVRYYREAFDAIEDTAQGRFDVLHNMQTNGTLLTPAWVEVIEAENIRIGISVDGPAYLHDLHRKDRRGKGTHAQTLRGMQSLREARIPFHTISVVTADSLSYPDEIFDFFMENGVSEAGFNVEESEGGHGASSLNGPEQEKRVEAFWRRLFEREQTSGGVIRIREFERAMAAILGTDTKAPFADLAGRNDQVVPLKILSVAANGNFSTFSPELLGAANAIYGDFVFGNVHRRGAIAASLQSREFRKTASEIWRGIERCARTCEYYCVCGGGAPSNKLFENGAFESSETMYCRTSVQMPAQIVLEHLESRFESATA
jgi:uncharacterized protein